MLIRAFSDIHLEFGPLEVPIIDNEKETTLIFAGDIGLADRPKTFVPFLEAMSERHKRVIMVLGNHEHYRCSISRSLDKINEAVAGVADHLFVIDNDAVIDEEQKVAFIGSTLWTDANGGDPMTKMALYRMNDFVLIRTGPSTDPYKYKFTPELMCEIHKKAKKYLFEAITMHKDAGLKVVVVTHHAPSTLSIHPMYKRTENDRLMNGGYASALEESIVASSPDLWVHGHMHTSFDYMLHDTRIVCNPRGYYSHELNPEFDPNKVIVV